MCKAACGYEGSLSRDEILYILQKCDNVPVQLYSSCVFQNNDSEN